MGEVLLRWAVSHDYAVIPKSVNKSRQERNIRILEFDLDQEDMKALDGLNKMKKFAWDPKSVAWFEKIIKRLIIKKVEAPPRLELGFGDLESHVLPLHHRAAAEIALSAHFLKQTLHNFKRMSTEEDHYLKTF